MHVYQIFLLDHFVIECIRKKARERNKTVLRCFRNYKKNYDRDAPVDLLHTKLAETTTEKGPTLARAIPPVADVVSS